MRKESSCTTLYWLEFIRFFATISVLLWHYQHFFYVEYIARDFSCNLQPGYSIFKIFYQYGFYGVQVFWAISGYIFFWKYRDLISDSTLYNHVNFKNFFVLRFSRLYPLHFITFLYVAFVQYFYHSYNGYYYVYRYNDLYHAILNVFMAQNWLNTHWSYNSPSWSVSIEILIYILFFVLCKIIGKLKIMPVLIFIISIFLCMFFNHHFFECALLFFCGGTIHFIHEQFKLFNKFITCILLMFSLLSLSLVKFSKPYLLIYLITFIMVIYVLLDNSFFDRVIAGMYMGKTIKFLGSITFSMYLLHFPIQLTFATILSWLNLQIPVYNKLFFFSFISSTFLAGIVSYFFFEKPVQTRIRKFYLVNP